MSCFRETCKFKCSDFSQWHRAHTEVKRLCLFFLQILTFAFLSQENQFLISTGAPSALCCNSPGSFIHLAFGALAWGQGGHRTQARPDGLRVVSNLRDCINVVLYHRATFRGALWDARTGDKVLGIQHLDPSAPCVSKGWDPALVLSEPWGQWPCPGATRDGLSCCALGLGWPHLKYCVKFGAPQCWKAMNPLGSI